MSPLRAGLHDFLGAWLRYNPQYSDKLILMGSAFLWCFATRRSTQAMAVVLVKCCNAVAEYHSNARRVGLSEYHEWKIFRASCPPPYGSAKLFKSLRAIESASLCFALHPKKPHTPTCRTAVSSLNQKSPQLLRLRRHLKFGMIRPKNRLPSDTPAPIINHSLMPRSFNS